MSPWTACSGHPQTQQPFYRQEAHTLPCASCPDAHPPVPKHSRNTSLVATYEGSLLHRVVAHATLLVGSLQPHADAAMLCKLMADRQTDRQTFVSYSRWMAVQTCSCAMFAVVRALKVMKMGAQLSLGKPCTRCLLMYVDLPVPAACTPLSCKSCCRDTHACAADAACACAVQQTWHVMHNLLRSMAQLANPNHVHHSDCKS